MLVYEVDSDTADFRYKVWFYKDQAVWRIEHIQLIRGVEPFLPKQFVTETFDNERALIEYAINYSEMVVKNFSAVEFQKP